mmetsp:Transcript_21889/g.36247  ORF Transcript_21889/g.36247 Transcript_21889/m.36247 type:complete len:166 (-) Transcript_21889:223-720(-)
MEHFEKCREIVETNLCCVYSSVRDLSLCENTGANACLQSSLDQKTSQSRLFVSREVPAAISPSALILPTNLNGQLCLEDGLDVLSPTEHDGEDVFRSRTDSLVGLNQGDHALYTGGERREVNDSSALLEMHGWSYLPAEADSDDQFFEVQQSGCDSPVEYISSAF